MERNDCNVRHTKGKLYQCSEAKVVDFFLPPSISLVTSSVLPEKAYATRNLRSLSGVFLLYKFLGVDASNALLNILHQSSIGVQLSRGSVCLGPEAIPKITDSRLQQLSGLKADLQPHKLGRTSCAEMGSRAA